MRTIEAAAAWVDRVGLALLFPKADVVLPSLWREVNGSEDDNWAVREPDGTFVRWSEEMGFLWNAKDELPARGLACVGKHLARVTSLVAPRLLPTLCAQVDRTVPEGLVLTSSHLVEQDAGWGAVAHDLVDRKWRLPNRLPPAAEARRELASLVLEGAGELTAADLAGVLGWRRAQCATVLDELAPSRTESEFRIWTAP